MKIRNKVYAVFLAIILMFGLSACGSVTALDKSENGQERQETIEKSDIPDYSGKATIEINDNQPEFSDDDFITDSYESYSKLDDEGRCQTAQACVGKDIMPTKKRGSIGMVKPTGWHTVKYDTVDGKYLYNRCHLIAYQLTGENANEKNLITGTRYFNVEGMLPYEEMVGDYVRETGNHVLYRVTPVFEGDSQVAKGVQMEAISVEDQGKDIEFNVFVYNVQPGIAIDYQTGESRLASEKTTTASETKDSGTAETIIRGNRKSKVYHCPGQRDYETMKDSKNLIVFGSEKEAKAAGYRKAQR